MVLWDLMPLSLYQQGFDNQTTSSSSAWSNLQSYYKLCERRFWMPQYSFWRGLLSFCRWSRKSKKSVCSVRHVTARSQQPAYFEISNWKGEHLWYHSTCTAIVSSPAILTAPNEKILCDKYKITSFPPSICEHHKVDNKAVSRSATPVADETYTNKGMLWFWAANPVHFVKLWARSYTHFLCFFFIVFMPKNIQQNETCCHPM